jgi:3-hydroxyisobutyrate dehydrogenase
MSGHNTHRRQSIGWVGLGKMGTPIVFNLLKAGYDVVVFDSNAERAAEMMRYGARPAPDLANLASTTCVVFSIVSDDVALSKVALGSKGVLSNMSQNGVFVDMSTVSPSASMTVRDAAKAKSIDYIAASVSGSAELAEQAQLTVFASGQRAAFERVLSIFGAISAKQYYVGTDQQARYLKLAINHLVGSSAVLLAEALTLGKKGGLDWADMLAVITDSVVASPLLKYKLDLLKRRDFKPAFSSKQMLKDMSLVVDAGVSAGVPMAAASLVRRRFADYVEADGAELDFFSIVRAVESDAGLHN